ncbi:MAG: hypothetical protein JWM91_998 [Rhodospirillales bacterium]|nr:hypothetical protein [Rhodospirillales bacterium]
MTRLIWPIAITLFLASATAHGQTGYQLGHGYDLGPFNFGGYGAVAAYVPDRGSGTISAEDISLFATGHISQLFNPFIEAELTHLDFVHPGSSHSSGDSGSLVLERLYDDMNLTDSFTLRLGKMLAPVGEWNEIHAAPLVLTAVRPAVTYRNFSEYLTGASLLYSNPNGSVPDLQFYWQPDREFSERPSTLTFHTYKMVEGLHVKFPISLLDQIGVSVQHSQDFQGVDQALVGIDFKYTLQKLTLQGEWTYSALSGRTSGLVRKNEWGGYLAASYNFAEEWSAYSWYEEFSNRTSFAAARDLLFGVAYRPDAAIVIKLEYLQNIGGKPVNPTGLFASWSVLF